MKIEKLFIWKKIFASYNDEDCNESLVIENIFDELHESFKQKKFEKFSDLIIHTN